MNFARLHKSERLQRVDAYLSDGEWRTTLDIIWNCRVCAVNSVIAELRANGRVIECERRGEVWWYRKMR